MLFSCFYHGVNVIRADRPSHHPLIFQQSSSLKQLWKPRKIKNKKKEKPQAWAVSSLQGPDAEPLSPVDQAADLGGFIVHHFLCCSVFVLPSLPKQHMRLTKKWGRHRAFLAIIWSDIYMPHSSTSAWGKQELTLQTLSQIGDATKSVLKHPGKRKTPENNRDE